MLASAGWVGLVIVGSVPELVSFGLPWGGAIDSVGVTMHRLPQRAADPAGAPSAATWITSAWSGSAFPAWRSNGPELTVTLTRPAHRGTNSCIRVVRDSVDEPERAIPTGTAVIRRIATGICVHDQVWRPGCLSPLRSHEGRPGTRRYRAPGRRYQHICGACAPVTTVSTDTRHNAGHGLVSWSKGRRRNAG